ncbi:Chloroplast envelope quinone oxidoreductase [Cocos nucifera]|uniref:Chloroplast envelope quinone oxidoreductase n=1 Tax=Cocos nucifera TaxID=13894 RepID=A0A8K0INS0_COCNU|nr:Chloroplast envelope quinone oxidoreductase [Cocos nucifera]
MGKQGKRKEGKMWERFHLALMPNATLPYTHFVKQAHVKVPIPSPKKDEILLKLEATSINPVDWKFQKGVARPFLPPKFPFIPYDKFSLLLFAQGLLGDLIKIMNFCVDIFCYALPIAESRIAFYNTNSLVFDSYHLYLTRGVDVAGEVIEVGPGVSSFKAGDKVAAMLNFPNGDGLAEFAVASVALTVSRPSEVSAAEGASLPTAAATALQALKAGGIKFDGTNKPSNVLITAASGGVGHYAVQLAKLANLHVTATCGARNIELVKSLGADEVLDYKTPDGASLKSPSGRKYDSVIHCTTGIGWSTFEPNLTTNGKVIDITPSFKGMVTTVLNKVTFSKKQLVPFLISPKGEDLKFLVDLAKEGKLKTVVDSRHPLSKAEEAWAKSMDGHATGKIIVEM